MAVLSKARVIPVVAAALALTACTANTPPPDIGVVTTATTSAAPVTTGFGPGAAGIGDAYFPLAGNGGYDVANYNLDLRYEPTSGQLTGVATITATATANLTAFNLDLRALTVRKVTIDGADARSQADQDELTVTPAKHLPRGTKFVAVIRYDGVPKAYSEPDLGDVGFLRKGDSAVAIGEPQVAASWYPVNDHPRDKATYTIKIAAPDGLTALSNGVLKSKSSAGGVTTWTWSESKPMASYLATVVIGHYRLQQTTHDGLPVVTAVDTSLPTRIDTQLARSGEIIDFLASKFGPYPFDAIGGIVIADDRIHFALENQTRPIYGKGFFNNPGVDASWVIVHELAHQWYGDSVSVNDWKEIWLNEGFATYAEWLWHDAKGERTAQRTFDNLYAQADAKMWAVPPGDPGEADLFGSSVYDRGAMTLHALRVTVGDAAFFAILKAWAADKANGNGTTPEFIALAERISGKQLDTLFQDWLYGKKRPPRP
jgi:aminopeptidase N